jgi:hypothetical protein
MFDLDMARNTQKSWKWEMHTVWPGICLDTLTKLENEKQTL